MTKKDYILIGKELRDDREGLGQATQAGFDLAVAALCRGLQKDNSAFNPHLFTQFVEGKVDERGRLIKK